MFDLKDFNYFLSTSQFNASCRVNWSVQCFLSSQLAQGFRRSSLLSKLFTPNDRRQTYADFNSSPSSSCTVELKIRSMCTWFPQIPIVFFYCCHLKCLYLKDGFKPRGHPPLGRQESLACNIAGDEGFVEGTPCRRVVLRRWSQ